MIPPMLSSTPPSSDDELTGDEGKSFDADSSFDITGLSQKLTTWHTTEPADSTAAAESAAAGRADRPGAASAQAAAAGRACPGAAGPDEWAAFSAAPPPDAARPLGPTGDRAGRAGASAADHGSAGAASAGPESSVPAAPADSAARPVSPGDGESWLTCGGRRPASAGAEAAGGPQLESTVPASRSAESSDSEDGAGRGRTARSAGSSDHEDTADRGRSAPSLDSEVSSDQEAPVDRWTMYAAASAEAAAGTGAEAGVAGPLDVRLSSSRSSSRGEPSDCEGGGAAPSDRPRLPPAETAADCEHSAEAAPSAEPSGWERPVGQRSEAEGTPSAASASPPPDLGPEQDDFGDFTAPSETTAPVGDSGDFLASSDVTVPADGFGNFTASCDAAAPVDEFGDFTSHAEMAPPSGDFGDFEAPSDPVALDDDFGAFTTRTETAAPTDDFGDFAAPSNVAASAAEFGDFMAPVGRAGDTVVPAGNLDGLSTFSGDCSAASAAGSGVDPVASADEFGDFSSPADFPTAAGSSASGGGRPTAGFADFGAAFSAASDDWAGVPVSQQRAGPAGPDEDEFGEFETCPTPGSRPPLPADSPQMAAALLARLFPSPSAEEAQPAPVPLDASSVWYQLRQADSTAAAQYRWLGSRTNAHLLRALRVDTSNIISFGGGWSAEEGRFSTGPDRETLQPVQAGPSEQSRLEAAPAGEVPPAAFDWNSSVLKNPLDAPGSGSCGLLDLDVLDTNSGPLPAPNTFLSCLEQELMAGGAADLTTPGVGSVYSQLLAQAAGPALSEDAARVVARIPNIDFMQAKVLMFPVRGE